MDTNKFVGEKIKFFREEQNLSLADLAEKTGLSPTYISNLENEQKTNPSKSVMEKLAKHLNKSVTELFF